MASRHRNNCGILSIAVLLAAVAAIGAVGTDCNGQSNPSAPAVRRVALVVGVNHYDKRGLADKPLRFAEADVVALAEELKQQGFEVRLLKGSAASQDRATLANIVAAVDKLLADRNAADIVVLAFAGHGCQKPQSDIAGTYVRDASGRIQEDVYFCPVDASVSETQTLFSLTQLLKQLGTRGGINMVLVDACRDDPERSAGGIVGDELSNRMPKNTAIFYGCAARQQSLETDQAGGGHGIFFHHVLEGLRGKAADRRGRVTWTSLVGYVQDEVNLSAKAWFPDRDTETAEGRVQTPHLIGNLIDVVEFRRLATTPDRTDSYPASCTNSIGMRFVRILPGEFTMGSPPTEKDRGDSENQHPVRITRGFWLGKYEVTVGQYRRFVEESGYRTEAEKNGVGGFGFQAKTGQFVRSPVYSWKNAGFQQSDHHPVVNVSWNDAVAFIRWLSRQEGQTYRLPTEAEWEFACRAGTKTSFVSGDDPKEVVAYGNLADATAKRRFADWATVPTHDGAVFTAVVGRYRPNAFGIHDMHGNVWEWCADWSQPLPTETQIDPTGPTDGQRRVLRGGGWGFTPKIVRSACRVGIEPGDCGFVFGFRVVLDPAENDEPK